MPHVVWRVTAHSAETGKPLESRTLRIVEKGNTTYFLEPATQPPIWKGKAKQAIDTALKYLRVSEGTPLIISARRGSTESKEYRRPGKTAGILMSRKKCSRCWIVQVNRYIPGVLDGSRVSVVWIEQKTGEVVKHGIYTDGG